MMATAALVVVCAAALLAIGGQRMGAIRECGGVQRKAEWRVG